MDTLIVPQETQKFNLPNAFQASNVEDLHTPILIAIIGLLLFLIFFFVLDLLHDWLRNERQLRDLERGEAPNEGEPLARNATISADWSHDQAAAIHRRNLWVLETLHRFVQGLEGRRGLRREELEKLLPLVNYKSNETKWSHEGCAICLEDFKDEDLCRVFPVCSHIFHLDCIDSWVRNNATCPVCRRNCILNLDLEMNSS